MEQLRLLGCLKRTAYFWLQTVPDRFLITVSFLVRDARYRPESITDFAVGTLILD